MKKAVIFDLDGVISDTQQFHSQIESDLLKQFHISLSPNYLAKNYAGISDIEMFSTIFNEHKISNIDLSVIISKKSTLMKKIPAKKILPIPHVVELITDLKKNRYHLAIASGSPMSFILHVVSVLNLTESFDVIVSADEVLHGKPEPELFLYAASKLGIEPKYCVVIEDSTSGIKAAHKAGMKSIFLNTTSTINETDNNTKIISSLNEVTLELLTKL